MIGLLSGTILSITDTCQQVTGEAVVGLLVLQVSVGIVEKARGLFVTFSFIVIFVLKLCSKEKLTVRYRCVFSG